MVGICLFVRMTLQEMLISKSEKMILGELLGKRVLCFILNPRICQTMRSSFGYIETRASSVII
jgi:hypothetical protein